MHFKCYGQMPAFAYESGGEASDSVDIFSLAPGVSYSGKQKKNVPTFSGSTFASLALGMNNTEIDVLLG